jgi:hypothetical protein
VPRNIVGQIFDRLTVIEFAGYRLNPNGSKHALWKCRCICDKETIVRGCNLHSKLVKSCGCLKREATARRCTTHGHSRRGAMTREYNAWRAMKNRCLLVTCTQYPLYGGRGITICQPWAESFEAFYEDMGPCPPGRELDRINNDGNYEPSNCRWATRLQQMRNVGVNALRDLDDKHVSWSQAAEWLAMPWWTLRRRLLAART